PVSRGLCAFKASPRQGSLRTGYSGHFPAGRAGFLAPVARTLSSCAWPVAWLRLTSASSFVDEGGFHDEASDPGVPRGGSAGEHRGAGPGHPAVSTAAE